MIIKEADEKKSQIATLEALATRHDASSDVRKRIEQEIRNIQAGIKGEEEAAYEINFHFGSAKNYAVIHDLRIEVEGRVAQIDHLVIGRFLDIWVCETKYFSEGIAINEQGECSRFFNNKPAGMASPFEQNKKHIKVLDSLFKSGMVKIPRRLGIAIKPNMSNVVIVSKNARISRPKGKVSGIENIIKSDQFMALIERDNERDTNPLLMAKVIGTGTLEKFAREIAAQHKPISYNWAGKFGLADSHPRCAPAPVATTTQNTPATLSAQAVVPVRSEDVGAAAEDGKKPKKNLICATCSEPVAYHVARFCWLNKNRFGENIYCRGCQQAV
jgi:hypothetical protein